MSLGAWGSGKTPAPFPSTLPGMPVTAVAAQEERAPVAYEDHTHAQAHFHERVKHCLLAIGSTDPDRDIEFMGDYVDNAETAGLDPSVVAATVFTATHHGHLTANVGLGATVSPLAAEEGSDRLWKVEYVNSRRKAEKVLVTAPDSAGAIAKAKADADSRSAPMDTRHQVRVTPERKTRLVAGELVAGERMPAPGYWAMGPSGKAIDGPFSTRDEAARIAWISGGYVQYEAGEAKAKEVAPVAAEAPRKPDIEQALMRDKLYRKLMSNLYKHEPGTDAFAKADAQVAKRRTELLTDPEFKAAEEAPVAMECGCPHETHPDGRHPEDVEPKGQMAADRRPPPKARLSGCMASRRGRGLLLRRMRRSASTSVKRRTPDRRHGILPHPLFLNGKELARLRHEERRAGLRAGIRRGGAVRRPGWHARRIGPDCRALVNGAKIVDGCLPWVRVTRDVEKFGACADAAKRIGPIDSERKVYDLVSPTWPHRIRKFSSSCCRCARAAPKRSQRSPEASDRSVAVDTVDIVRPVIIAAGAASYWVCPRAPLERGRDALRSDRKLTRAVEKAARRLRPMSASMVTSSSATGVRKRLDRGKSPRSADRR